MTPEAPVGEWRISHFKVEHLLAHQVDVVWPIFLDVRAWIIDYRIEAIAWTEDHPIHVGGLSRVTPLHGEALENRDFSYVMDVYEVIPRREIVLWLTTDHPEAFEVADLSVFYHWLLAEEGESTRLTIEQFAAYKPLPGTTRWDGLRSGDPADPESYHQYRSPTDSWFTNLAELDRLLSITRPSD